MILVKSDGVSIIYLLSCYLYWKCCLGVPGNPANYLKTSKCFWVVDVVTALLRKIDGGWAVFELH